MILDESISIYKKRREKTVNRLLKDKKLVQLLFNRLKY